MEANTEAQQYTTHACIDACGSHTTGVKECQGTGKSPPAAPNANSKHTFLCHCYRDRAVCVHVCVCVCEWGVRVGCGSGCNVCIPNSPFVSNTHWPSVCTCMRTCGVQHRQPFYGLRSEWVWP